MIDSGAMAGNKKKVTHPEQDASYAVGDRVKVNLHTGRIVDAPGDTDLSLSEPIELRTCQLSTGEPRVVAYCTETVPQRWQTKERSHSALSRAYVEWLCLPTRSSRNTKMTPAIKTYAVRAGDGDRRSVLRNRVDVKNEPAPTHKYQDGPENQLAVGPLHRRA
jgi:hypothetical protein